MFSRDWDLEYLADPEFGWTFEPFRQGKGYESGTLREYQLLKGKLYRVERLVVPRALGREVVEVVHRREHGGVTKTVSLVSQRCVVFDLKKLTENVLQQCVQCQRCQPRNQPPFQAVSSLCQCPIMFILTCVWILWPCRRSGQGTWFLIVL